MGINWNKIYGKTKVKKTVEKWNKKKKKEEYSMKLSMNVSLIWLVIFIACKNSLVIFCMTISLYMSNEMDPAVEVGFCS